MSTSSLSIGSLTSMQKFILDLFDLSSVRVLCVCVVAGMSLTYHHPTIPIHLAASLPIHPTRYSKKDHTAALTYHQPIDRLKYADRRRADPYPNGNQWFEGKSPNEG